MQLRQAALLCYLQILRRFLINYTSSGMRRTCAYDAVNRITQITDSNGRIIQYQYDAAGNRTTMTTPDSRTIAYSYGVRGTVYLIINGHHTGLPQRLRGVLQ
jgi:YD repeat-containing protein